MSEPNSDKKSLNLRKRLGAGVLLLAAFVAFVFLVVNRESSKPIRQTTGALLQHADSASEAPTAAPDTARPREQANAGRDSTFVKHKPRQQREGSSSAAGADTSKPDTADNGQAESPDTAVSAGEAGTAKSAIGGCAGDTLVPWVYPEPSGGLHRGPVSVTFRANKPCDVSWRFENDTAWRPWSGSPVAVDSTATLAFKALDRCGRAMAERREYYEIAEGLTAGLCPEGMELVRIGAMRFCIDRYEWPNRKGALPVSYVSLAQAKDSCAAAGKRLCSSEEWSLACSGPYSYTYPYGREYERYACVTHDTTVRPSGSRPECRAFFGMFDMSGNLLEWTSTPSRQNRQFNDVMGGFWQSGPRSGCFDIRYSYFPQNRHNPVGFRCCKASAPAEK